MLNLFSIQHVSISLILIMKFDLMFLKRGFNGGLLYIPLCPYLASQTSYWQLSRFIKASWLYDVITECIDGQFNTLVSGRPLAGIVHSHWLNGLLIIILSYIFMLLKKYNRYTLAIDLIIFSSLWSITWYQKHCYSY